MSFKITFRNLWTYSPDDASSRAPLSQLSSDNNHVHGHLEIRVCDKLLPDLGFFGPDDVCLNDWAIELASARYELSLVDNGEYTFDEGEQGQPAYLFRRHKTLVIVSVVDSILSGQPGRPEWGNPACDWTEFDTSIEIFLRGLRTELELQAPHAAAQWWDDVVISSTGSQFDAAKS